MVRGHRRIWRLSWNCAINNSTLSKTLMMNRCEARSVEGFVQHLAVTLVSHGYYFYVTGRVPEGKPSERVDRKLVERYGAGLSKWARARRKQAGMANVRYVRHGRFFVLIATAGQHSFFAEEPHFRDIRERPIKFHGYSIGCKRGVDGKWHPSVRIHPDEYRELKAYLLDLAAHRSADRLAVEFRRIRFEPYAPVRRQLLNVLRAVNRRRKEAGFEPVPIAALRLRRCVVRPFDESGSGRGVATPGALGGESEQFLEAREGEFESVLFGPAALKVVRGR